jgi:hypothetical protein
VKSASKSIFPGGVAAILIHTGEVQGSIPCASTGNAINQ